MQKITRKEWLIRLNTRFFSHVDKDGPIPKHKPELGPCHLWLLSCDDLGYGFICVDYKEHRAHRIAWLLHTGKWPKKWVLHHCDNPSCVRVSHLFEGGPQENFDDTRLKGTYMPQPLQTYCARRHELTVQNVYIRPDNGKR